MTPTDQPPPTEGLRPIHEVPSALDDWDRIAGALAPGPAAMFLDFDGTLAPIVDQPERAALPDGVRPLLVRLAAAAPVALVSGRGADDVRARVDVEGLHVAGSHGFEIIAPDGTRHLHPEAASAEPSLDAVTAEVEREVGAIRGVVVESKRFGLSVHDRMVADADLARVRAATAAAVEHRPDLRLTVGKRVSEVRPALAWDKGAAVAFLLDRLDRRGAGPAVYLGDDRTDEDAFAVLGADAITVVVADLADRTRTTRARFRVDDPGQVRTLLERLVGLLAPTSED